ncbi:MAG TPA: phage holin family protein [Polyangiaceae bacterium]
MSGPEQPSKLREPPIGDLIQDALHDATELVRAEFSLAAAELKKEAGLAMGAAAAWAATATFAVIAFTLLVAGAFLAAGAHWPVALLGTAGVFVALAIAGAVVARRLAPRHILGQARDRVANDVRQIKEHAS